MEDSLKKKKKKERFLSFNDHGLMLCEDALFVMCGVVFPQNG